MQEYQKLIESAKGEMGEVREENERLKVLLAQLVKEYESLQMHFFDILRQHHNQQQEEEATKATKGTADHRSRIEHNINEENELVSLSLGFPSKDHSTKDESKNSNNKEYEKNLGEGLALGLGEVEATNIVSIEGSSYEEGKEEEATQIWPPSKVLKTIRSGANTTTTSQQAQPKTARVSIRARCDTQMMNDGCQWRKYGQKIAKGNPCPRAYYRCNVSPSCPVRKRVQRCAEDMSILITTYEGTHNHPLPNAATSMASTTSLADSMLHSPSSSSSHLSPSLLTSSSTPLPPNYNHLNFNYNNNSALNLSNINSRPPHHQQLFYFPHSSISTSNSHPTSTLDLTSPPSSSSYHDHFRKLTSSVFSPIPIPTYNISPNISSSSSTFSPHYGGGNYFSNYGNGTVLLPPHMINRNQSTGKQPFLQQQQQQQTTLQEETVAAATKAITTNPKFQSAIAAALTTYVGANTNNNNGGVGAGLNLELGGGGYSSSSSWRYNTNNNNVFSSGGVNNGQQGNLILFPPTSLMASSVLPAASGSASAPVSSDTSNQILEQWKRKNLTMLQRNQTFDQ